MKKAVLIVLCLIILPALTEAGGRQRGGSSSKWEDYGTGTIRPKGGKGVSVGGDTFKVDTNANGVEDIFASSASGFIKPPGFFWKSNGSWWFQPIDINYPNWKTGGTIFAGDSGNSVWAKGGFGGGVSSYDVESKAYVIVNLGVAKYHVVNLQDSSPILYLTAYREDCGLMLQNSVAGEYKVLVNQAGSSARTITWSGANGCGNALEFAHGVTPILTKKLGEGDVFDMVYGLENGTTIYVSPATLGKTLEMDRARYKSDGTYWLVDVSGNTRVSISSTGGVSIYDVANPDKVAFETLATGGVSMQRTGGADYGMGNTDLYGYLTAGVLSMPGNLALTAADPCPAGGGNTYKVDLSGQQLAGGLVYTKESGATMVYKLPVISGTTLSGTGTTAYVTIRDEFGTGISVVATGTSIYVLDKNKYRSGNTLMAKAQPWGGGHQIQLQAAYNAVTGWYYAVTALSGVSWSQYKTKDVGGVPTMERVGFKFIGLGSLDN